MSLSDANSGGHFGSDPLDPWSNSLYNDTARNSQIPESIPRSYYDAFNEFKYGDEATVGSLLALFDACFIAPEHQKTISEIIGVKLQDEPTVSISTAQWNQSCALVSFLQNGKEPTKELVLGQLNQLPDIVYENATNAARSHRWNDSSILHDSYRHATQDSYNPTSKNTINIRIVPEKEGVFMFRHVVYILEGVMGLPSKSLRVSRRYSDFLWLYECLLKKYPFRMVPILPPKRLTLDGRYLSSDSYFLEKRRRGLLRFVNQLVKHPTLKNDNIVVAFLTIDAEISIWRKQAAVETEEEFNGKTANLAFISRWNDNDEYKFWDETKRYVEKGIELLNQLCVLIHRSSKLKESIANDAKSLSTTIGALALTVPKIYLREDGDIPLIQAGLKAVHRFFEHSNSLEMDDSRSLETGLLEDLKQYRDQLLSIRELFSRYERKGHNNIPQLEKRIEANKQKISILSSKPNVKESEVLSLKEAVRADKALIEEQRNRDWLIKECISEELILGQKTQYQISKLLREWSLDGVKYSELNSENWTALNNDVSELPLPTQ